MAPSAPSSPRALDQLHRARVQVRAARLVQAVAQAPGDQVPVAPGEARASSSAAWPTLNTASAIGTSAGSAARAVVVRTASCGHDHHRLEPRGRVEAHGARPSAHTTKPPSQRRGGVVGMALELGRERQQVGVELEEVVGGHQPGDDRRGARPQAAGRAGSPSGCGTRSRRPGAARSNAAHAQVATGRARRRARSRPRTRRSPPPRAPGAAPARRRARRTPGRGWPRRPERGPAGAALPSRCSQPSTARSTAASSGSHGTTAPACVQRGLRVLQPVAGQHADDALARRRRRSAAARPPTPPRPARRRRPRAAASRR